jgi:osmotically-inducible protein OsmY
MPLKPDGNRDSKRKTMKTLKPLLCALAVVACGFLSGCSKSAKSADVVSSVRAGIAQAGLTDVTTKQDLDKGVVTLGGHVSTDADKDRAEAIAKTLAGPQVVANEIAVISPGSETEAKKVNSSLDKGIENNLEAALVGAKLNQSVSYSVKNHVVTLTGEVNSSVLRARAETIAGGVLNVQQVVNELQVKKQKATSTN